MASEERDRASLRSINPERRGIFAVAPGAFFASANIGVKLETLSPSVSQLEELGRSRACSGKNLQLALGRR